MSSLKKLAIELTGIMEVRDAAGAVMSDENGVWSITHHSPGSKPFQKAKHTYDEKRSNSITALMTGKGDAKRGPDEDLRDTAEFLAAITISFNGFDYEGKLGYEAYKAAYMDLEIGHVANDLNKYLGDRGNYLKAKPQTSNDMSDTQPG